MRVRSLLAAAALCAAPAALRAQTPADSVLFRALELETKGANAEAARLFRDALRGSSSGTALLGLERVLAELGRTDSLLPLLDTLVARQPRDPVVRSVQLRALHMLGRFEEAGRAFDHWVRASPGSAEPYRDYVQLLMQAGRSVQADSVLRGASAQVKEHGLLASETAQLHAALGRWTQSAERWRLAVSQAPYLEQAAVFSLTAAPTAVRDSVRRALRSLPAALTPRRVLASLELSWGRAADGWSALGELPADQPTIAAWVEFAESAERAEAWTAARDAFRAAYDATRAPPWAARAAAAALAAGDHGGALMLGTALAALGDSAVAARTAAPLIVTALSRMGRVAAAERTLGAYARWLDDGARARLTRELAAGWVRGGDVTRARAALAAAGAGDAGGGEVAGWIALFAGDLGGARAAFRRVDHPSPDVVLAQSVLARTRDDGGRVLGGAFLALTRGDSAGASALFGVAADSVPDAGPLLLAIAARLGAASGGDQERALALWQMIANVHTHSPEGAEAHLEWARALRRRGDRAGAAAVLENLVLTYPRSALVPQARYELERVRGSMPTP